MPMMTSQILKPVDFTRTKAQKAQAQKSRYLENEIFFFQIKKMGITKPCTHFTHVISTSHRLISASTQLSGTP